MNTMDTMKAKSVSLNNIGTLLLKKNINKNIINKTNSYTITLVKSK